MSSIVTVDAGPQSFGISGELTANDVLAMPNEKHFELRDGQLVERKAGNESSEFAANLLALINLFCRKQGLGRVCGADGGFLFLREGKENLRKPDISFFRRGRLPIGQGWSKGYERIAPDLAVEVVSPNDLASEVDDKIEEYRTVGVKLIWVVQPTSRTVTVVRLDGSTTRLGIANQLNGEDVLPGFECSVADIFETAPAD